MKTFSLDQILVKVTSKAFSAIEKKANHKHSLIHLVIFSILASLFSSFPSYDIVGSDEMKENWTAILEQTEHPFAPMNFHSSSHQANLSFRLTPVLIARCLKVDTVLEFLVLQFVAFVCLITGIALLFKKIDNDPVVHYLLTLSVAFTFVGNVLCSDYRGFFDVFAYLFIVGSMLFTNSILVFFMLLFAYFTDERALFASGLISIFIYFNETSGNLRSGSKWFKILSRPRVLALVFSWISYIALRLLLSSIFGLHSNSEGLVDYLLTQTIHQINILPFGAWTGLEGFWLLVIFSVFVLFMNKNYLVMSWYLLALLVVVFIGIWVFDVTRSMAYLLPSIFLSLSILTKTDSENILRSIAFFVLVLSIFPTYYAGGPNEVHWLFPLPIQILRMLFF